MENIYPRFKYCVVVMCGILRVSKSGYYNWLNRKPSKRAQEEGRLEVQIECLPTRGPVRLAGPERLQHELKEQGVKSRDLPDRTGPGRSWGYGASKRESSGPPPIPSIPFLCQRICSISSLKQRGRTKFGSATYPYPDSKGWLYLAGHKDLFTGEIVGYAMGNRLTKNLVSQSLFKAVAAKRPGAGLIHHSDRGRQYCAHEYRRLMDQFKMKASMSRKGDCYDNAPIESFWGTLKNELVHHRRYRAENRPSERSRST